MGPALVVVIVTGLLAVWNLIVIHTISKAFFGYVQRRQGIPAQYVGRKVVHILGGGVTTLLIPVFYEGYYWVVVVSAFLLAAYIELRRKWRPLYWFQIAENAYEVHFAVAYGGILAIGVALGNVWIGLIPMLFMSFGDSATGLVRAFRQRRHTKSWDGTVAMLAVCAAIGYWRLGWYGLPLATAASLVERMPRVDDNITVPLLSAFLVYLKPLVVV